MIPLRSDLHSVWDTHGFALVPKESHFVVHVLFNTSKTASEFAMEWHNVSLRREALEDKMDEFLLARFAQAVFWLAEPFLVASVERKVVRLRADLDDGGKTRGFDMVEERLSPGDI